MLAVSYLFFGCAYLFLANDLPFGSVSKPLTGFMPKLFGAALVILALINAFIELRKPTEKNGELEQVDRKKAVLFVVTCIGYVVFLKFIGYLFATIIALFCFIKFTGMKGWKAPLIVSISVSVFFYFVFVKLLSVPLIEAPF